MSEELSQKQRMLNAFRQLASTKNIRYVTHEEIAVLAETSAHEVKMAFPAMIDLIDHHLMNIHEDTIDAYRFDEEESPKDRLFDLLMTYFDALQEERALFLNVEKYLRSHPHLFCQRQSQIRTLFRKILLRCGISTEGLRGRVKVHALSIIFWATYRIWRTDETDDMGPTMAALDKYLNRAQDFQTRASQLCIRTTKETS